MPPATRFEREEERRLNTRTLVVASVASASAAAVTSQLWIAGTWIAAALTPVLVTLISEALHRPTERVARAWTSDRPPRAQPGPMRVYREPAPRPVLTGRRKIAIGTVAATAAIAFAIAIVALTTVDLVSGGSIGKGSGRTTLLGGNSNGASGQQERAPGEDGAAEAAPRPNQPDTEEPAPEEPAPDEPTDTAPVPPSDTPAQDGPTPEALP